MTNDNNITDAPELTEAEQVAVRLRELADFVETRPLLAAEIAWSSKRLDVFPHVDNFAPILKELGTFTKDDYTSYIEAVHTLPSGVRVMVNLAKTDSCERVQVGVKTVTKEVYPDDVKPTIVEVEEPQYEWVCPDSWLTIGQPKDTM